MQASGVARRLKHSWKHGSMPRWHGLMRHTWAWLSPAHAPCADVWRSSLRRLRRSSPRLLTAASPLADAASVAPTAACCSPTVTRFHACGAGPGHPPAAHDEHVGTRAVRAWLCHCACLCVRASRASPVAPRAQAPEAPGGVIRVACVYVPWSGGWRLRAKRDGRCVADAWACGIAPPR